MEEVIISEYNSNWGREFEEEKIKILNALKDLQVVIEHIGSTSVPGLGSKPTIDMMAGIARLDLIGETHLRNLHEIGYEFVNKPEFPERLFFRRGQWRAGTHHLHIYKYGGKNWNNNLLFREYLKRNPEIKHEYYELKKKLEQKFKHDRVAYTEGKADYINGIIDRANDDLELKKLI
ncbi:GrpB family protein [Paenibacillus fonticola]|uniref:GrpB family protein n=1 Tax=Paenibacillus fonticola TaxID=379896 RepID=UPI0003795562|nr:GrpB family protein [Paenibacillus fonticola]